MLNFIYFFILGGWGGWVWGSILSQQEVLPTYLMKLLSVSKMFLKVVDWNVNSGGIIGAVDVLFICYIMVQIILKFIPVVPFDLKSLSFSYTASNP